MIRREDFIAAVKECIGTPVVHMGRVPGKALDCVGLPLVACQSLGLELPPTDAYNATPSGDDLTRGLSGYCDPVDDGGHLWQVFVGSQARHVVVPVGVNECGQPIIVHAWGYGRRVRQTIHTRAIVARWQIRGVE